MASGFDVTIKIGGREDVSRASVKAERSLTRLGTRGSRALRKIGTASASLTRGLRSALRQVLSLRGALVGLGLGLVFRWITRVSGAWEALKIQLETVLGSQREANRVFEETRKQAATTPFQISQLVEVRALLESIGIKGKEAVRTIGDAAGGMGRQIMDVAAAVISLETEPLRRLGIQLSRVGNIATFVFRDVMGRAITKVVTGPFLKMQQGLLKILDVKFKGGMERFSKTWRGMWSNVLDAAAEFANEIGEAGLLDVLKDFASKKLKPVIDRTTEWVKANKLLIEQKVWKVYEKIASALSIIPGKAAKAVEAIERLSGPIKALSAVSELAIGAAIGAQFAGLPGAAAGGIIGAIISTLRSLPKAIRETTFETRKQLLSLELEIKRVDNISKQLTLKRLTPEQKAQRGLRPLRGPLPDRDEIVPGLPPKIREIIKKTQSEILKLQGRGFDAQVLLQETAFANMLEKVGKFQEAREKLEALHQLKLQDIVEKREAALAAFVTKELGIGLERDFLRRQQERKVARQVRLLEEALDRGIISIDNFREGERRLRDSLDLTAAAAANQANEAEMLTPALDDAGQAVRNLGDAQERLTGLVDLTTGALVRNAAAARESAAAAAALGRGPIADLLGLLQLSPSDPRRQAAGGGFRILRSLRDLGFSGGVSFAQHGAILDGPTALIGGEAGRELVVPERRSQRSPEVQAEFERLAAAEGGQDIVVPITINMDGRTVAKRVFRHKHRGAA